MGAPQIIFIVFLAMGVTINLVKHNQYRHGERYNFWLSLFTCAIEVALLKWGGFF